MLISSRSLLRLENIPPALRTAILDDLTIRNPEYATAVRLGIPTYRIPRYIKLYSVTQNGLTVPRGYMARLHELLGRHSVCTDFEDHSCLYPIAKITSKIELRDYQKPAVEAMTTGRHRQGVLVAPPGSGKTEVALEIMARLRQRTLWLTHREDLLVQTMDRAKARLVCEIGDIGIIRAKDNCPGRLLTVASVPTLARRADLGPLVQDYGTVIVDEAHRCIQNEKALGQFLAVLTQVPARYRFGVTATPDRGDGLAQSMYTILGPKIYEITQTALRASGCTIVPSVQFVTTEFRYMQMDDKMTNFGQLLAAMAADEDRNRIIHEWILRCSTTMTAGLVLGNSLDHLELLQQRIPEAIPSAFVHGGTPKKQRKEIFEQLADGRIKLLFASYSLAKEGLDIPILDHLFLVTPMRDKSSIQQAVGRIMRPAPDKTGAWVIDFYDQSVSLCINHARRRRLDVYTPLGCEIKGLPSKKDRTQDLLDTLSGAF